MTVAYHQVSHDRVEQILQAGLKCTPKRAKGSEPAIARTDYFLDTQRPEELRRACLIRCSCIYAYAVDNTKVVDITNGSRIELKALVARSAQAILELRLDTRRCYISDLDAFDALKDHFGSMSVDAKAITLAAHYWSRVKPLASCDISGYRRPEIIITYDIEPSAIRLVT